MVTRSPRWLRLLSIFAVVSAVSLHADTGDLVAHYRLGSDFDDSSSSGLTSLASYGESGTADFTGQSWEWGGPVTNPGRGLQLSFNEKISLSNYTLALSFSFSEVKSYRKLIDFGDLSSDAGIYAYDDAVTFFNSGNGVDQAGSLSPNTYTHLLITRDSGQMRLYLNGELASFGSDDYFLDQRNDFIISQNLYFGVDDRNGGEFVPSGGFANLQLWDYVLSESEIAAVAGAAAIPEASTAALIAGVAGLGFVLLYRRRR